MKLLRKLAVVIVALGSVSVAQADLIDRGGGLIYDDESDITWLQDANFAKTSGFDFDGLMDWASASSWTDGLSFFDSVRSVMWDDWRLPTTLQPDVTCTNQDFNGSYGHDCTGSELGHLFHDELGGVTNSPISTTHNNNYNLFDNIQDFYYWSETEYALDTTIAWSFDFGASAGYQDASPKLNNDKYAWAVRDGDVASVPEPGTLGLLGIGLFALALRRRQALLSVHGMPS